jgi:hypothetical protein
VKLERGDAIAWGPDGESSRGRVDATAAGACSVRA